MAAHEQRGGRGVSAARRSAPHLARQLVNAVRAAPPALASGVAASLAATTLMLALRLWAGVVTLPELVGERILPFLSADNFVLLLLLFGKVRPLAYALLGQLILGVLLAPLYAQLAQTRSERIARFAGPAGVRAGWAAGRREWTVAALLAAAMWLVAVVLFWPNLAENLYGYSVPASYVVTCFWLAVIFAAYGLTLLAVFHALSQPRLRGQAGGQAQTLTRRALLADAGVAAASIVIGLPLLNALISTLLARSNVTYDGMVTPPLSGGTVSPITPISRFYVVSKNVVDPTVRLDLWSLEVTGLVAHPQSYTLDALQRLPQTARAITLECISNQVGGQLLSTANWRGVLLADVLRDRGGALPNGKEVFFTSVDGYHAGQPLDELVARGALLAWEMNGEPLPARHGYPLRLIAPDYFGEHSVKWLSRIEILDHHESGFYQQQGWHWGPLHTLSRIDFPTTHAQAPLRPIEVAGVAFAGTRGIARVELSADGGQTWRDATLTPPLSPQAWTLWSWVWTPPSAGSYTLVVRATDGTGALQTATEQRTVPGGATGYHKVPVTIVG